VFGWGPLELGPRVTAQFDINLVGKATALSNKLQTKYAHVFVSRQKVAQSGHPADRPFESNGIQVEQRGIGTLQ